MKTIQLATIPQAENARKPTIGRAVPSAKRPISAVMTELQANSTQLPMALSPE